MNRILYTLLFVVLSTAIFGQAKKYALLEHFTNTWCSICASRNPAFYNTIKDYPNLVHHISVHPSIPYQGCIFYQANMADNNARKDFYNVQGTPTVFLNGTRTSGGQLITPTALNAVENETSPFAIAVSETSGNDRNVVVDIHTVGPPPGGNLRVFVALVEKEIAYTSPNRETLHHDVLRKFLTSNAGYPYTSPAQGGSVRLNYSYSIESGWAADQMYVLVWLQDIVTKEVFNSGTRFDEAFSNVGEVVFPRFSLSPNPATDQIALHLEKPTSGQLSIIDQTGKLVLTRVFENLNSGQTIDISHLQTGLHYCLLRENNQTIVQKFIKH